MNFTSILSPRAAQNSRGPTWERGSSSELGKSYWFKSLALKTGSAAGLVCWGVAAADEGKTFGFFSYFLLGLITSGLSCCKKKKAA